MSPGFGFTATELSVFRRLKRPEKIQEFLDSEVGYNKEPHGATCGSPRRVLRDRLAQCIEGALLGAAALRMIGHPPLLMDLEAVHDTDHVIAVFRSHGGWGAVAKSNFSGLRFREPVYRSLRELAMSYFEHYYNLRREKTLRTYSRPINLRRFDGQGWMTAEEDIWYVPEYLCEVSHTPLLDHTQIRNLTRMDRRLFEAGLWGKVK